MTPENGDDRTDAERVRDKLADAGLREDDMLVQRDKVVVYGDDPLPDEVIDLVNHDDDVQLVSFGGDEMTFAVQHREADE